MVSSATAANKIMFFFIIGWVFGFFGFLPDQRLFGSLWNISCSSGVDLLSVFFRVGGGLFVRFFMLDTKLL
jgi:hypothetical protein